MSRRKALRWIESNMADQTGRTVVITGATSGIGEAAARFYAGLGARVILAVRNVEKGRRLAAASPTRMEARALDLASLRSIRSFVESIDEPIDALINNAGVMQNDWAETEDGFELHFGVNHLGPFALTGLLAPRLRGAVVAVSSHAHRAGVIDFDDIQLRANYSPMKAYAQSKLANLLFIQEFARRAQEAGSGLQATAAHPGLTKSNLLAGAQSDRVLRFTRFAQGRLGQSTEMGALPLLMAASPQTQNGDYIGPGGFYELAGPPKRVEMRNHARDPEVAARLWALSEKLTGVIYDFSAAAPAGRVNVAAPT